MGIFFRRRARDKTLDEAITLVKEYAGQWDVPWGQVTPIERAKSMWTWFEYREYELTFESEFGSGRAKIYAQCSLPYRFEFYPTHADYCMVPLWAYSPGSDSMTMQWRDGPDCDYKYRWHYWYRGLSEASRTAYKQRFSAPPDESRAWEGYYEWCADVRGDPASLKDNIFGRVP